MKIVCKKTIYTGFLELLPKICGKSVFTENFLTRKFWHFAQFNLIISLKNEVTEIKIFQKWSIDQAIEETANKDTQSTPVTKGYNHKSGAVVRYSITADSFFGTQRYGKLLQHS